MPWPEDRGCGRFYLKKGGILIPVVVLLAGVFPRDPEDGLLVVLPHQTGVFPAVHLLDEPLAQLSVAAAPGASVIQLCVHLGTDTLLRRWGPLTHWLLCCASTPVLQCVWKVESSVKLT